VNTHFVQARDLGDAWFQCLFRILDEGRSFKIDRGSYAGHIRHEFDWITVHIKFPNTRPLLPQIPPQYNIPNPVDDSYLESYLPYLMTGEMKENESYTYGQRLTRYPIGFHKNFLNNHDITIDEVEELKEKNIIFFDDKMNCLCLNQIELLIWTYKERGFRNNQMVLQVGHPADMLLKDPPCLRHVDTRIQDGKLHFFPYFRSWDLYSGFPANLAALQLMKEYVALCIGVDDGEMIATSKGLHLYGYVIDLAKCITMKEDFQLNKKEME